VSTQKLAPTDRRYRTRCRHCRRSLVGSRRARKGLCGVCRDKPAISKRYTSPFKMGQRPTFTFDGFTGNETQWAARLGIKVCGFSQRVKRGLRGAQLFVKGRIATDRRIMVTFEGETVSRTELAVRFGLARDTLVNRLKRGLSLEKALTMPKYFLYGKVFFTFRGETLCRRKWETRLGIYPGSLAQRLASGWPLEYALTQTADCAAAIPPEYTLVTRAEVARRLTMRECDVCEWVRIGLIPEVRLTRNTRRYRWEDVVAALK
jgi:hypothetical protein